MPWASTLDWGDASTGYSTDIYLDKVVDSGELKEDFSTLAGEQLSNIRIGGGETSVTVCFKPASKSFRTDLNTKFDEDGALNPDECDPDEKDTSLDPFPCWWCIM